MPRKPIKLIRFASALRRNVSIDTLKYPGLQVHDMKLGGKTIGRIRVNEGKVEDSWLDRKYQGMGLGKKMYGEVLRRTPGAVIESDDVVSDAAKRVYESMSRRPKSYQVSKVRGRQGPVFVARLRKKLFARIAKLTALSRVMNAIEFRQREPREKKELTGLQKIGRVLGPLAAGAGLIAIASKFQRPKKATPILDAEGKPYRAATKEIEAQMDGAVAARRRERYEQRKAAQKSASAVNILEAKVRAYFFNDRDVYGDGRFGAAAGVATAFRKGQRALPWIRRGGRVVEDTSDYAAGRPPKKPFWKESWAKRLAQGAAIGAGFYAVRNVPKWANEADAVLNRGGPTLKTRYPKTYKARQMVVEKAPDWLSGAKRRDGKGFRLPMFSAKTGKMILLDAAADYRGWDVRDPRGRSARVFAPGSRRRERREKSSLEKVSTIRAVRNAAIAAAVAGGVGAGVAVKQAKQNARVLKAQYRNKITARGGPRGLKPKNPLTTSLTSYKKPEESVFIPFPAYEPSKRKILQ